MTHRRKRNLGLLLALVLFAALSVLWMPRAIGGIGPSGFAQYAQQGIVNENNVVYGKGNSPWLVSCTDHPNYTTNNDYVTCTVKGK